MKRVLLAVCCALSIAVVACDDALPVFQEEPAAVSQAQPLEQPEEVDDSLCALLDPLINRLSITEPRVNVGDVVDAIEAGATINVRCADGISPLHHAAASHGVPVVELLLEHGADIHAVSNAGETPLLYAIGGRGGADDNDPELETLLNAGADINWKMEYGQSALHVAAAFGKPNALATLLEHGPDLEPVDHRGLTALHYAAAYNATTEPARLLLEAGLDPNASSDAGVTPLHFAAIYGSAEVSRMLLDAGADVNPIDADAMSPLLYAASAGGAALIRVLLEYGADPNIVNPDGRTALHIAARENPLSAVAELLLNAGANTRIRDRHGNTPCDLMSGHLSDPEVRQRICERN